MSRYSAEVEWSFIKGGPCFYSVYRVVNGKKVEIHEIINLNEIKLSKIIHEINECELYHLLYEKFKEEMKGIEVIRITPRIIQNFPEEFEGVNVEILITHILSPYGTLNCLMPKKKFRARW